MRKLILMLSIFILIALVGCSEKATEPSEPISSSDESTVSTSEEISAYETTSSNPVIEDSSNQEISSESQSGTLQTDTTTAEKPTDNTQTTSPIVHETQNPKPTETNPPAETQKPANSEISFSKLSVSYSGYNSAAEPTPYLKGKAIYDVLYSGVRAQVGDTLIFFVSTAPANATDSFTVSVSENLKYTVSGNTITIGVNGKGKYDIGIVSVSSRQNPSLSQTIRFTIDNAGNPLDDFANVLGNYIAVCGMRYCTVEKGYTTDNPSLSITNFDGAPAWDDKIAKSSDDWMARSLNLIDEYKRHSFKKVNFIITPTEIGFSASN